MFIDFAQGDVMKTWNFGALASQHQILILIKSLEFLGPGWPDPDFH